MRTVVIGIGNTTLRDDGVGVVAARELARRVDSGGVSDVTDLGAGGLRLMEAMAGYDRAIVLDSLTTGLVPPGTTVELEIGDLTSARNLACIHDMTLPVAMEWGRAAGIHLPDEVRFFGVEAADVTTFSEALTPEVAEAVPALVEQVRLLLTAAGNEGESA